MLVTRHRHSTYEKHRTVQFTVQLTGTVCKSRDFNTSRLISGFHSEVRIAAVACSTIEVSIIEIIERLCHYVFFIEKILEYVNILCSFHILCYDVPLGYNPVVK